MIVRKAHSSNDLPELLRGASAFRQHFDPSSKYTSQHTLGAAFKNLLWSPGFECLVVEHDGALVAGIGYRIGPYLWDESKLVGEEIFWWAHPEAPTCSAMLLFRRMIKSWKDAGVSVKICHCLKSSPAAVRKLYERNGMQDIETMFMGVV